MTYPYQLSSRRNFLKGITATTAAGIAMPNLLLRAQYRKGWEYSAKDI